MGRAGKGKPFISNSSEPKAHWCAYSIGRHPLSDIVRRLSNFSNNIFYEAIKLILSIFHI